MCLCICVLCACKCNHISVCVYKWRTVDKHDRWAPMNANKWSVPVHVTLAKWQGTPGNKSIFLIRLGISKANTLVLTLTMTHIPSFPKRTNPVDLCVQCLKGWCAHKATANTHLSHNRINIHHSKTFSEVITDYSKSLLVCAVLGPVSVETLKNVQSK